MLEQTCVEQDKRVRQGREQRARSGFAWSSPQGSESVVYPHPQGTDLRMEQGVSGSSQSPVWQSFWQRHPQAFFLEQTREQSGMGSVQEERGDSSSGRSS